MKRIYIIESIQDGRFIVSIDGDGICAIVDSAAKLANYMKAEALAFAKKLAVQPVAA